MGTWQHLKDAAKFRLRRGFGVEDLRAWAELIVSRVELSIDRAEALSRRLERMEQQLATLSRSVDELTQASQRRPTYSSRPLVSDAPHTLAQE